MDYAYLDNGFLQSINATQSGGNDLESCTPYLSTIAATPSSNPDGNDLFYLALGYDQDIYGDISSTLQTNGNISSPCRQQAYGGRWMVWQVKGRERQAYGFDYDYLDRLKEGNFHKIANGTNQVTQINSAYGVEFSYDARGNFTSIKRYSLIGDGSTDCWSYGLLTIYFQRTTAGQIAIKISLIMAMCHCGTKDISTIRLEVETIPTT